MKAKERERIGKKEISPQMDKIKTVKNDKEKKRKIYLNISCFCLSFSGTKRKKYLFLLTPRVTE